MPRLPTDAAEADAIVGDLPELAESFRLYWSWP
jgi:hypothetical protein